MREAVRQAPARDTRDTSPRQVAEVLPRSDTVPAARVGRIADAALPPHGRPGGASDAGSPPGAERAVTPAWSPLPSPAPKVPEVPSDPRAAPRSDRSLPAPAPDTRPDRRGVNTARVIALAGQVAERRASQARLARARADLARSRALARELVGAVASDLPIAPFRAALRGLFGDHAPRAEAAIRNRLLDEDADAVAHRIRQDPRSLLPGPRVGVLAGGTEARRVAAAKVAAAAASLARLDGTLIAACDHVGHARPQDLADAGACRRAVLDRLRDLIPAQRAVLEEARQHRRGTADRLARAPELRRAWRVLTVEEREAARAAVPAVDRLLMRRRRRRHRDSPGREGR